MKPKTIGILGGAGPLAGVALLERVLCFSQTLYGCYRDADFPKVILLSFPFSEMLSQEVDASQIRKELKKCLGDLKKQGAEVLAIACNTLHAFLEGKQEGEEGFVHLPRIVASHVVAEPSLVLCTSLSARMGLHQSFFPCIYPDTKAQQLVDEAIDAVLQGKKKSQIARRLSKMLEAHKADTIVLGCTELSLLSEELGVFGKRIIDPLEIAAQKIVEKSFKR